MIDKDKRSILRNQLFRLLIILGALCLITGSTRCFEQGGFAARIDYRRDPPTRVGADDLKWIEELLKAQKLR